MCVDECDDALLATRGWKGWRHRHHKHGCEHTVAHVHSDTHTHTLVNVEAVELFLKRGRHTSLSGIMQIAQLMQQSPSFPHLCIWSPVCLLWPTSNSCYTHFLLQCVCLCVTMCAWMTSSGKQWFPQPVTRSQTPTGISVHLPVSFFKLCCTPGCGEGAERHFVFVFSAHVCMYERTCMHIWLVLGVYYSIFVSKTTMCVCSCVSER